MYHNYFNILKLVSLILLGSLLHCSDVIAQNKKIVDSLTSILSNSSDREKAAVLMDIGIEYTRGDNEKGLPYFEEAYSISIKNGDSLGIVSSGWLKGEILRRIERMNESNEILNYILGIAERNGIQKYYKRILNTQELYHNLPEKYD